MLRLEKEVYGNNQPPPPQYPQQEPVTAQPGPPGPFIPVNSAAEAWAYAADWMGGKQYFKNERDGEIYIKWFDANGPTTHKETYRKTDTLPDTIEQERPDVTVSIMNQLSILEMDINEIKGMLRDGKNPTVDLEVDSPEVSWSGGNNGESDGNRPAGKQPRGVDGKFRAGSKK